MFKNDPYTSAHITFVQAAGREAQVVHPAMEFEVLREGLNDIRGEIGELTSPPSPVLINKLLEHMTGQVPKYTTSIDGGWDAPRFTFVAVLERKGDTTYASGYTSPVEAGKGVDDDTQLYINRTITLKKVTVNTPGGEKQLTSLWQDTVFLRGVRGLCTLRPTDLFGAMQLAEDRTIAGGELMDMRSHFSGGLVKCYRGQLDNPTHYVNELVGAYASASCENPGERGAMQLYGECVQQTSSPLQASGDLVNRLMAATDQWGELSFKLPELKVALDLSDIEVLTAMGRSIVPRYVAVAEVGSIHSYLGNQVITTIAGLLSEHGLHRTVVNFDEGVVRIMAANTLSGQSVSQEVLDELHDHLMGELPSLLRTDRHSVTFTAEVDLFHEAYVIIGINSPNLPSGEVRVDRPMWASGAWSKFITNEVSFLNRLAADTQHLLRML
jgi:hypothetical protein